MPSNFGCVMSASGQTGGQNDDGAPRKNSEGKRLVFVGTPPGPGRRTCELEDGGLNVGEKKQITPKPPVQHGPLLLRSAVG